MLVGEVGPLSVVTVFVRDLAVNQSSLAMVEDSPFVFSEGMRSLGSATSPEDQMVW